MTTISGSGSWLWSDSRLWMSRLRSRSMSWSWLESMYSNEASRQSNSLNAKVGEVPTRETEISKVFSRLFGIIEVCQSSVEQLRERINPVMNGGGAKSADKEVKPEFSSGLAQEISRAVNLLEKMNDSLVDMKNRVEL